MQWIDGHLDLAYIAQEGRDVRVEAPDPARGCVSLPALRAAGVETVLATIFTAPDEEGPWGYPAGDAAAAEAAGLTQVAVYERLAAEGEVSIAHTAADLAGGAVPRLVLLMEGADPIRGPEDVPAWRERGVRLVGLAWARGTRYAGGNASGGPLTPAGADLVRALDHAGIAHDASHLSDEAFDGLLAHASGPIVATHSNCRALVADDERHLRDEQIRAIADRGGLVGLNLHAPFLAAGRRATIADCVRHVEHVAAVMGHRRGVALGSDMDGGFPPDRLPAGLDHPSKLPALAAALRRSGWSDEEVGGFAGGNWFRWMEEEGLGD